MKIVLASKNEKKVEKMQRIANKFFQGKVTVICLSNIFEAKEVEQVDEKGILDRTPFNENY